MRKFDHKMREHNFKITGSIIKKERYLYCTRRKKYEDLLSIDRSVY